MALNYRVQGPYFESCNCDPICPCRRIGDVPGGRSTYGECYGVLCWQIELGAVGDVDVSGLNVALVYEYDDDEDGSPWTFALHLDARGDDAQREALERLYLHELKQLPWIRKASHLVGVRTSRIEADATRVRIGETIALAASRRFETTLPVACGIPGYDRFGYEMVADELRADDGPFQWRIEGNCAYVSDFDYRSS
jgi:hypothetical protein